MNIIDGGVCAAKGFKAAGLNAGIRNKKKKDMAMVYSEAKCSKAGTFTTNKVQAAPVKWDKKVAFESEFAQAMVINSGIANACTGEEGMEKCREMANCTGEALNIPAEAVFVASTGVIGMQIPMEPVRSGISLLKDELAASKEAAALAAEAIMTTDTVPKQVAVETVIGGKTVRVGGMCKGSGMIHPNMATMLCFVTSDVAVTDEVLHTALLDIVNDTFNMISVDGDTSTNDSVLVLANGMAGNELIDKCEGEDYEKLYEALFYVLKELSKKIAGDGEGATCLFEVRVINDISKDNARILAKSVITSSLTKAAIFGHDANWGRIICALGYSGAEFDPEKVDLWFESENGKLKIVENGSATDYSEELATKILSSEHVIATADVKAGEASATAYGCDLTFDYVKINADYRS